MWKEIFIAILLFVIVSPMIIRGLIFTKAKGEMLCPFPEVELSTGTEEMRDLPSNFKPLYSQKIPMRIVQTNFRNIVPAKVKYTTDWLLSQNPEYEYIYFDDERCRKFLIENYDQRVIECYDLIVPGAYKADIFRAFYLQKCGGVYIDCGQRTNIPFREMLQPSDEFVSVKDIHFGIIDNFKEKCIYNAFIACVPNHPIIKRYCDIIISNIENRDYGDSFLSITGPGALGKAFIDVIGKNPKLGDFGNGVRLYHLTLSGKLESDGKLFVSDSVNDFITTKYEGYYSDQRKKNKPYYCKYYFHRQVFGESGPLPVKFDKNYKIEEKKEVKKKKVKVFSNFRIYPGSVKSKKKIVPLNGEIQTITLPIPQNRIESKVAKFLMMNNPDFNFVFDVEGEVDLKYCILTPFRELKGKIIKDGKAIYNRGCYVENNYLVSEAVL